MKDTTLLVKTFKRPDILGRLLDSLRDHYPRAHVLVGDDSGESAFEGIKRYGPLEYLTLPLDVGLAAGRNALVDEAETELVVLLDDDFVFTAETQIERLLAFVRAGVYDVMCGAVRQGGKVMHYEGTAEIRDHILYLENIPDDGPCRVDVGFNFFAARREVLADVRWDEVFKLGEHLDFYLRAKQAGVKVGYLARAIMDHLRCPEHTPEYASFRQRRDFYETVFRDKWNLIDVKGTLHRVCRT